MEHAVRAESRAAGAGSACFGIVLPQNVNKGWKAHKYGNFRVFTLKEQNAQNKKR